MAALTKWFDPSVKPVRRGWYETKAESDSLVFMAYWTGAKWLWDTWSTANECLFQDRYWRGLKAPAK